MKVLVAGATGALGNASIRKLVAAGHSVVGISRTAAAADLLNAIGADIAVGDVLDAREIRRILCHHRPDAVVHAAKAIPKRGPMTYRDMRGTNSLHAEGTKNLVAGARDAGVARLVIESVVFAYGYGHVSTSPITEAAPRYLDLPEKLHTIREALLAMEREAERAHAAGEVEATILRCGVFYGPNATDRLAHLLRWRAAPLPRAAAALWPLAYIDDAADAVVASLTGPTGQLVDVVDDQPVAPTELFRAIAERIGAPPPLSLPTPLVRAFAPYFAAVATSTLPVDNAAAANILGWRPAHRTYREGLDAWLGAPKNFPARAASGTCRRSSESPSER